MDKNVILKSLSKKSNGEIYLGVVGAVRTGKSTFIKKVIETLVLPNMNDEIEKKRCMDEIPQTASGKQIMTIEPKFVPSNGATLNLEDLKVNIKLVDCVGYVTPGSIGYEDELGNPRMVKTPWYSEEVSFIDAATIGTEKVIKDHATIGIVITTDGSITDLPRSNYIDAENKVINELKNINKPFIVILNSSHPNSDNTIKISEGLSEKYNIPVIPMNIETMNEKDIINVLKEALYEFPIEHIEFNIPDWISELPITHEIKKEFLNKMKDSVIDIDKLRDTNKIQDKLTSTGNISNAYMTNLNTNDYEVTITLDASDELYNEVLKSLIGKTIDSRADLIKIFSEYSSNKNEFSSVKEALKQVYSTGCGVILPSAHDMKLDKPEVIKQGSRYGVKLKANAPSIYMFKVDVDSSFEPIIGSESQSKQLIDTLINNSKTGEDVWKSEIFGRSLDEIVGEGINAKIGFMAESSKYKISQTLSKMVNKGSNSLITIVL